MCQTVQNQPSHGENTGSSPVGVTNNFMYLAKTCRFSVQNWIKNLSAALKIPQSNSVA
jgi:hypothetical protein